MLYHGFFIEISPAENIPRENSFGDIVFCRGYEIRIFSDSEQNIPINSFYAAVGFEILSDTLEDAEQFAKDVIDLEQKKYLDDQA